MNIVYLIIAAPDYNLMKRLDQTGLSGSLSCYCYAQGIKVTGGVNDEKGSRSRALPL